MNILLVILFLITGATSAQARSYHHHHPAPTPSPLPSLKPSPTPSARPSASPSPTPLASPSPLPSPTGIGNQLFFDDFMRPNGPETNEYAYWSPSDPKAVKSANWEMDSGSFFIQGNQGWTGVPDDTAPNATSSNGTNSAVFRLTTKRADFGDVSVSFSLLNQWLSSTKSTPPVDWDGVHIFLRYQSEFNLYYASVNRRDNTCVIKKKIPGGPSNGGTYYDLTAYVPFKVPYNAWQQVQATVKNNADGSVTISLYDGGKLIVTVTDNGKLGGPPITKAGKVGIRCDNANVKFDDFQVNAL